MPPKPPNSAGSRTSSQIQLHADAALNTLADAGLQAKDLDGVATAGESPVAIAHYLGIAPRWVDGSSVGGCSFMLHVRHAAAAIEAGYADTILVTHGESGRSGVGRGGGGGGGRASLPAQFEAPYGPMGPTTMFTIGVLRYMKQYGMTHEQLANVAVVQREWAGMNPRASYRDPITVDDVLNSRMIAYPFHLLECCLVTDGGGALILTKAERAKDFPNKPVYILGSGESVESPMVSQMKDLTSSQAFRIAGGEAMRSAGIGHADVDHLMVYDAFAHLPIWGLEDLGFCARGEAAGIHRRRQHTARRQAAAQHQRRWPVLHALRHVRHVRAAGKRSPDARHGSRTSARCASFGVSRCRRHVRRQRLHRHDQSETVTH